MGSCVSQNHNEEKADRLSANDLDYYKAFRPSPFIDADGNLYGQDYDKLYKKTRQNGGLFEDPIFKADNSSLFHSQSKDIPNLKWKRPLELTANAEIFQQERWQTFDVKPGDLGNCWMVSALSSLSRNPKEFSKVLPKGQLIHKKGYAGIFQFRFWHCGRWVNVVVDDRLPSVNFEPVYMSSTLDDEFWAALVEKAYAKLLGSYELLNGVHFSEALVDLTGGHSEQVSLKSFDGRENELFEQMKLAFDEGSHIGCKKELKTSHLFNISNVAEQTLLLNGEIIQKKMIQINFCCDNGATWSRSCHEWPQISQHSGSKELWITVKDLVKNFQILEFCHPATNLVSQFHGQFEMNNGFFIELKSDSKVTISLIQTQKSIHTLLDIAIGFEVYDITRGEFVESRDLTDYREMCLDFQFRKGRYQIIPTSVQGEGNFYLRFFSKNKIHVKKVDSRHLMYEIGKY